MKKILVTGCAGFIGFHLCEWLCQRGDIIVGIDNLNAYYDPALKAARLERLQRFNHFKFIKLDIADRDVMQQLFQQEAFSSVVHLAAQAGVRYSLTAPDAYVDANLVGFANILENCRQRQIENLVFASSSSVYGANTVYPFKESDTTDQPLALYGATKKANELMAHSYAHLFGLPCTGLRFFTVYGPWGRPDMALFKFTKNMLSGQPIEIFNHGNMARDFTYIDDIVSGIICALDHPGLYRIYNIGCGQPVQLLDFVEILERELAIKAIKKMLPMQAGDVAMTFADTRKLAQELGYQPKTSLAAGVKQFVAWYKAYYPAAVLK